MCSLLLEGFVHVLKESFGGQQVQYCIVFFFFLLLQNVRTVLLSVISLLNEPNTYSPANVDASVMYRRWRDSKGKDKEYENIIR